MNGAAFFVEGRSVCPVSSRTPCGGIAADESVKALSSFTAFGRRDAAAFGIYTAFATNFNGGMEL